MYSYKFINIKHSYWTGKPNSKIEDVIEKYAERGWRLVQVVQDHAAMWYKGRLHTKIILERKVDADYYEGVEERFYLENELV